MMFPEDAKFDIVCNTQYSQFLQYKTLYIYHRYSLLGNE